MLNRRFSLTKPLPWCVAALLLMVAVGCSTAPEPSATSTAGAVHKMDPDQEFSGFLGDYSQLTPSPELEDTLGYVNEAEEKNIHKYIAIMIDPIEVYVATDDDPSDLPEAGRQATANYFKLAMANAVSDAFPIVNEPGPLVLRLRAALVGVDVGDEVTGEMPEHATPLQRSINIGELGIEVELVDSVTGERIAAAVNRTPFGEGAEIGAANFSRVERYELAREAFNGWAEAIREFLDDAHELSDEDAERAVQSYQPY